MGNGEYKRADGNVRVCDVHMYGICTWPFRVPEICHVETVCGFVGSWHVVLVGVHIRLFDIMQTTLWPCG